MAYNWQSYRFENPTAPWQQMFNALATQDPNLAYSWVMNPANPFQQDMKSAIDTAAFGAPFNPEGNSWPSSIGNALIDAYSQPAAIGPATAANLGLTEGWSSPVSAPQQYLPKSPQLWWQTPEQYAAIPGIDPSAWNTPSMLTGLTGTGGTGGGTTPPPPTGGGGGGTTPLPGYGISQTLNGFGIPGHEMNPMVGGGSWEGTTWNPAPFSDYRDPVIPNSDTTNPSSPYYRPPNTNPDGTPITPGSLDIRPAVPYQTSWYLQTYNGKRAPWENIHQQIGDSMKGIQPAKPGFNWSSPQALSQLGGYGLPGGWTSMLGFAPGGNK